jgi:protein gp37
MAETKIEWTDRTWNPVTGCTKVSPGCDHCYAEGIAHRFAGTPAFPRGFDVTLHPERLDAPLRWRRPARVFVNSMSDLFHDQVSDEFIARVFAVMAATPQHTYQVLTKRHGRMRSLLSSPTFHRIVAEQRHGEMGRTYPEDALPWPLGNVWCGVSVEDQKRADLRIPALLDTPAAVRFLSCEPLLGPVLLRGWVQEPRGCCPDQPGRECVSEPGQRSVDWVILGGESGAGARPMHLDWARALVEQCRDAAVPVFVKQLGSAWAWSSGWGGKGALPEQWPADLRVREWPTAVSA